MKLIPRSNMVIITRRETTERSEGKILIPPAVKDQFMQATVVAVGPGHYMDNGERADPELNPGDNVLVQAIMPSRIKPNAKPNTLPMKIDGLDCLLISETEIVATIEDDEGDENVGES